MENLEKIRLALNDLKADYLRRYGYALFDLDVALTADGCRLTGRVLIDAQRKKALDLASEIIPGIIEDRIEILDDLEASAPLGWAAAVRLTNVWRYLPDSAAAELNNKNSNLSSQLEEGDAPVKVLCKEGSYWLVQLVDGTIGWISSEDLSPLELKADEVWPNIRRPAMGSAVEISKSYKDLADAALAYLGVPYLWGGATISGIDCSGFVQRAFAGGLGVVLPKHSREQLRAGKRIPRREIHPGDLIFFTVEGNVMHVGIVLEDERVVHASRVEKKVIVEPIEKALGERRFAGARRVVVFCDEPARAVSQGKDACVPNG